MGVANLDRKKERARLLQNQAENDAKIRRLQMNLQDVEKQLQRALITARFIESGLKWLEIRPA